MSEEQSQSNLTNDEQNLKKLDVVKITMNELKQQVTEIQLNYIRNLHETDKKLDEAKQELALKQEELDKLKSKYTDLEDEYKRLENLLELVHDYTRKTQKNGHQDLGEEW